MKDQSVNPPNREKQIFEKALDRDSPEDQAAFIVEACAGESALIARIHALLEASQSSSGFLPGQPGGSSAPPAARFEGPGSIIGRYKLLERIGEGGFGVVYMAEQMEPMRRKVALKILKPGMDTRQVIGRFEAERQALALMDHPSIAKVFDAGALPQSRDRPYFVMELVNGIPITEFCKQSKLGLESRLHLFIEVCGAVQHAHQKAVIHRDLKPSNILVTLHGDKAMPKLIDFGIAKAIEQPLTDKTVFTRFHQFLGTPAYMSPEQATYSGLDVDTRSDIYSLGVLLYELLTGTPPFDTKELLSVGLDEMRRIVRETEPVRPSLRLRRTASSFSATLPADLDWIVLKALEKDPNRRYETANNLAADIKRYLDREPVTAVAPTVAYRLSKFYQRNRRLARLGAAVIALLLMATVFSGWQLARARHAEATAKVEAQTATSVSEFLWKGLIKQLSPWGQTNRQISLREALDVAAGRIEGRLADQPLAEASVRLAFGKTYLSISELAKAQFHLERALALRRTHAGEDDLRTAEALFELAHSRAFQGERAQAGDLFSQAARIRARQLGSNHQDTLTAAAGALFNRYHLMPPAEALPLLEQLLEASRVHVGPESDLSRLAMNHVGILSAELGAYDRALELFAATARLASLNGGHNGVSALWSQTLSASTMAKQGRLDEAETLYREILEIQDRVIGGEHVVTLDARLAFVRDVLIPRRRFEEAAQILLDVAKIEQQRRESLRSSTRKAWQALEAAWVGRDGEPGLEQFHLLKDTLGLAPPDASGSGR